MMIDEYRNGFHIRSIRPIDKEPFMELRRSVSIIGEAYNEVPEFLDWDWIRFLEGTDGHYMAVFDKRDMDTVLLAFHLVYSGGLSETPGTFLLYDYPLPWYLSHLQYNNVVLRSPYLPDRLAKYQGNPEFYHNPAKTVYVRRNIGHILEKGYFSDELDFFRNLNQKIMPLFQWWYSDISTYEEKDGFRSDWRLERTKIRTRLSQR